MIPLPSPHLEDPGGFAALVLFYPGWRGGLYQLAFLVCSGCTLSGPCGKIQPLMKALGFGWPGLHPPGLFALVKISALAVCYFDVLEKKGRTGEGLEPPRPGHISPA